MKRLFELSCFEFALKAGAWSLLLGLGPFGPGASHVSSKEYESWLAEVDEFLTHSNTGSPGYLSGLPGLISSAQQKDERQTVLQAHVEVIKARTRMGRSWEDPELRLGYEERSVEDQVNKGIAIRFRLPDRADRRLLDKISHVDIDWANQQIDLLKSGLGVHVKRVYARAIFARMRLFSGNNRLRQLIEQEDQLIILQELGQSSVLDRARLLIKQLKLYRSLRNEFSAFRDAINELAGLGIDSSQAEQALHRGEWSELIVKELPAIESFLAIAFRNNRENLKYRREDAMLSIRLKEVKRSWLPSPAFFQLGWEERGKSRDSVRMNEWGALAGFDIDLFDDHEEELLLSIRRETDLKHALAIKGFEQEVKSRFADFQSVMVSYKTFESVFTPAVLTIRTVFDDSSNRSGNKKTFWDVQEDLFDLENEFLDMRWALVESQMKFEASIGQIISHVHYETPKAGNSAGD